MDIPLLITSAIQPPPNVRFLRMTNPVRRKLITKAALFFWVAKGIKQVVVADATSSKVLSEEDVAELTELGVAVEQISYAQDTTGLLQKGKGYAEGRLLEFALANSRLLAGATHFYKSTSKTFVRNFAEIHNMIANNPIDIMFWKHVELRDLARHWADSRFYFTSQAFARNHLLPAYLRSDDQVAACEAYLWEALNKNAETGLAVRPFVHGIEGHSDKDYFDQPLGVLDANWQCWFLRKP
jgi:hypothetical protein